MTGYDLQKRFGASVGHVWHAPDSQVYPELHRMEQAGLLGCEEIPWGRRSVKRWYHVTDQGGRALRAWMNSPLEYARVRDPAHLKAAYLEYAEPPAARRNLLAHISHHIELLRQWENQIHEIDNGTSTTLNKRLENSEAGARRRIRAFKRFAYEGLTAQAQQEIDWASRGLRLLDELYPGGESELPEPSWQDRTETPPATADSSIEEGDQ